MRPCGGFTPDMINFAHSTNVYKMWADMIAFDKTDLMCQDHQYCAFCGLRDGKNFVLSHGDILEKYQGHIKMESRIPDVLAPAMGNQFYIGTFKTKKELDAFYKDLLKCKKEK